MIKKIGLFLAAGPHDGGAFQYSQAVLNGICSLRECGFEVGIVTSSACWQESLSAYNVPCFMVGKDFWGRNFDRVRFLNPPISFVRAAVPYISSLASVMISMKCDLWIFPSQDVWSYQVPVPALVAVHDLMHRYERRFPEVSARGEYRMREWHYRNMCRWAKGILVDSEIGKRHVLENYKYPLEQIFVLPYIAPPSSLLSKPDRDFDSRYGLTEKFIFYPAQFWQHKNHTGLIRAIGMLKADIPDIQCFFLGSKKNGYQTAVELVREKGLEKHIHFLGYVPDQDIPLFYRRARAMVMPTFFGPTNIPPLEAFSCGCPVAISHVYGIPEQVGDAAVLFDPESVDEIAQAILKLWTDDGLCEDLKKKGLRKTASWGQTHFNARLKMIIETVLSET